MTAENPVVKDFIVPLAKYPHLKESQTLSTAVQTLLSHACGDTNRLRYSGILVIDDRQKLVGQLSLQTILQALDKRLMPPAGHEGKDGEYPNLTILWEDSFFNTCAEKKETLISTFMVASNTTVKGKDSLLKALSIMLHRNQVVLPVTEDGTVTGVIRLEEIFTAICGVCKL